MDACDTVMADAKQKATIILIQSSLNKKPAGASRSVPSGEGADGGGSWINFQKIRSKSVTAAWKNSFGRFRQFISSFLARRRQSYGATLSALQTGTFYRTVWAI